MYLESLSLIGQKSPFKWDVVFVRGSVPLGTELILYSEYLKQIRVLYSEYFKAN